MPDLNISLDRANLARFRRLAMASRVEAAKALTFTAERAVPAWIAGHTVFHRRNRWIDKGVRMRAATTANPVAQVGTLDKYMGRHIEGLGEPKEGSLFIPLYQRIGEVKTHKQERADLRRMQGTKRKPFRMQVGGETWIVRRQSKARFPLVFLGKLQRGAKVQPRLDALGIVSTVVQSVFPTVYERLLLKWAASGR